jgi:hypothetical protein
MSYDDIRKQLDILLGPNRDGVQREAPPTSFKDPRVCKYYLCGVCPHLLFSNTKAVSLESGCRLAIHLFFRTLDPVTKFMMII